MTCLEGIPPCSNRTRRPRGCRDLPLHIHITAAWGPAANGLMTWLGNLDLGLAPGLKPKVELGIWCKTADENVFRMATALPDTPAVSGASAAAAVLFTPPTVLFAPAGPSDREPRVQLEPQEWHFFSIRA